MTNGTIFFVCSTFSHFSSLCCAKNSSLISCITERMAKRMQEQSENRILAKSRPMVTNLTSSVATSSSSVDSPNASRSPGILKASSRLVGLTGRPDASANQNSNPDAAWSSQGCPRYSGKSQKVQKIQNPKSQIWPHHFHNITRLCTSHGESLLDRKKDL